MSVVQEATAVNVPLARHQSTAERAEERATPTGKSYFAVLCFGFRCVAAGFMFCSFCVVNLSFPVLHCWQASFGAHAKRLLPTHRVAAGASGGGVSTDYAQFERAIGRATQQT